MQLQAELFQCYELSLSTERVATRPAGMGPTMRYYLYRRHAGLNACHIIDSPCDETARIDYSDGSSQPLDESQLQQGTNIGRGSAPLTENSFPKWHKRWGQVTGESSNDASFGDWNLDERLNTDAIEANLIGDNNKCQRKKAAPGDTGQHNYQLLRDHDDWTALILRTGRGYPSKFGDGSINCNYTAVVSPNAVVAVSDLTAPVARLKITRPLSLQLCWSD